MHNQNIRIRLSKFYKQCLILFIVVNFEYPILFLLIMLKLRHAILDSKESYFSLFKTKKNILYLFTDLMYAVIAQLIFSWK